MRKHLLLALILTALLSLTSLPVRAAENGVIAGTIMNGTADGSPTQGVEVELFGFQGSSQELTRTAPAGEQGEFRFEGLETGADWVYLVRVSYSDVTYSEGPLSFEDGATELTADIRVYETTTDAANIAVERAHLLLAWTDEGLQVTEVQIFSNSGDRTYIGNNEVEGRRAAAQFVLPKGATDLAFNDGSLGGRFLATSDGFVDTEPRWPGSTSVIFSYGLACPDRDCTITKEFPAPTLNMNVLLPSVGIEIQSERLSFEGEVDAQGQSYLNYTARNLAAEEKVRLRFAPVGQDPSTSSSRSSGAGTFVIIGLGGLAVLAALAYPWLRKNTGNGPSSGNPRQDHEGS